MNGPEFDDFVWHPDARRLFIKCWYYFTIAFLTTIKKRDHDAKGNCKKKIFHHKYFVVAYLTIKILKTLHQKIAVCLKVLQPIVSCFPLINTSYLLIPSFFQERPFSMKLCPASYYDHDLASAASFLTMKYPDDCYVHALPEYPNDGEIPEIHLPFPFEVPSVLHQRLHHIPFCHQEIPGI